MRAIILLLSLLLSSVSFSDEAIDDQRLKNLFNKSLEEGSLNPDFSLYKKIEHVEKLLEGLSSRLHSDSNYQTTHRELELLKENYRRLKIKVDDLNSQSYLVKSVSTHNDWTGIMLGAASLIFTGLSVGIAMLAFWGFKNIKSSAVSNAIEQSRLAISEKIENGEFNEVIYRAVEKSIYRDILSQNDFPQEDMDDDK